MRIFFCFTKNTCLPSCRFTAQSFLFFDPGGLAVEQKEKTILQTDEMDSNDSAHRKLPV